MVIITLTLALGVKLPNAQMPDAVTVSIPITVFEIGSIKYAYNVLPAFVPTSVPVEIFKCVPLALPSISLNTVPVMPIGCKNSIVEVAVVGSSCPALSITV